MTLSPRQSLLATLAAFVLFLCVSALAAGAFWTTGPSLKCAVPAQGPAMAIHGTDDWVVPNDGGVIQVLPMRQAAYLTQAPSYFVGAEAWVATLAGLNGCDPTAQMLPPEGDVRGRRYTGCGQDAEVILYTIEDGGHQWPGGMTIPGAGKITMHIDATEEM